MKPVRSYVLRQGRISTAQKRAHQTLLPKYGIPYSESVLDLNRVFGRGAPKILEIGFGMGESTLAIAQTHLEHDYLGIEVHTPGVGSLLKHIDAAGLSNERIIQHDALEVLQRMLALDSFSGVHIFFPDPWPKKCHHKRRLIQPDFVSLLCQRMKAGAYLHVATDWPDYAEHILAVLDAEPGLVNTAETYVPRPDYRPLTKFEQRGVKLGHQVWDVVFKRKPF